MFRLFWHLGIPLCVAIWLGLSTGDDLFGPLWILPLVYIASSRMILRAKRSVTSGSFVHSLLLGMLSIRFVMVPLMMHLAGTDFYDTLAPVGPQDYRDAVLFMAYEGLATGVLVLGLTRVFLGGQLQDDVRPPDRMLTRGSLAQAALLMVGFGLLVLPQVRERYSFVTSEISGTARELIASYAAGYDSLASLSNLARMLAPALIITWAVRGYARSRANSYPLIAISLIVLLNLFYVVTSRASFFIPLAASGVALWILLPKARQITALLLGGGLIVATLMVTIQKSFDGGTSATNGWAANYLSTYLMGPQEYAVGLRSVAAYGSITDFGTLLNDLFGNVLGVSSLTDPINRTSQFFNWTYLGRSTIIGGGFIVPATIQALFYVGPILAPIGLVPGLALAFMGQRVAQNRRRSPAAVYLGSFALVAGVLFYANSVSTTLALASFPLLPGILLITFDNLLRKRTPDRSKAVRV